MTAEQLFHKLIYLDTQINADLEEIYRIRQMMDSIPSSGRDKGIMGKGEPSRKVENLVIRLINYEARITDEIDELVDLKELARKVLDELPSDQQRVVLQGFYIARKTSDMLAEEMDLSWRRIQAIKAEGLREAEKILIKMPHDS